MHKQPRSLIADMALGALAGLAATWAMGKVTTFLYARENDRVRQREDAVRGGKTSFGVAAEKAAHLAGRELSEDQRKKVGSRIHWGLGTGAGAAYGVLRHRLPGLDRGNGLAFGTAFWLLVDELGNPVLGLTPGPGAFPWQTHARGLAGHLAFGAATETALRLADRVTGSESNGARASAARTPRRRRGLGPEGSWSEGRRSTSAYPSAPPSPH